MSNATLSSPWLIVLVLWGCCFFVMGFWFLVVGFVNPLTLGVGPCYGLWAFDCLTMGIVTLVVGFVYLTLGF
jgi:hypothetical protein